jgi:hypothetical protein
MASRRGKYDHVTATLPRLSNVDPERQDIVTAVKNEIMTTSPDDSWTAAGNEAAVYRALTEMSGIFEVMLPLLKRLTSNGRKTSDLAGAYAQVRVVLDDHINRWKSNVQVVVDAYEQLMLDRMEADGVASIRLTDGASVATFLEPYSSVKDPEAFRLWCLNTCQICGRDKHNHPFVPEWEEQASVLTGVRNHEPETLERKLSMQWSTMNALNKERLLAGEPPTPGVEVTSRPVVRLTKA